MQDLRSVETHFSFGENWKSFVDLIDDDRVNEGLRSLKKLIPNDELRGARFLDIGCGSGLFLLSAAKLGASQVEGVDIDENSVEATTRLLSARLPGGKWSARVQSIFDLSAENDGTYDVVYSWGVLHHTGDMWRAVDNAMRLVRPGGLIAIALYRKTLLCNVWRVEKAFYSRASHTVQRVIRYVYKNAYRLALLTTGRNPKTYERNYRSNRGMSWTHDVHDWLGGYPYESASPAEVETFFANHGFEMVRSFTRRQVVGVFGAGCDEFVALRKV